MIETAAPNGYQMLAYPIQISWDTDGDLMASYAAGGATTGGVTVDGNTIIVPNSTGAELPETGGVGTTFLTCGGLLLMAAAVGGYALRRRRGKGAR